MRSTLIGAPCARALDARRHALTPPPPPPIKQNNNNDNNNSKPPSLPTLPSAPGARGGQQRGPALEDDLGADDPDEVVLVETEVPSVPGRRCRIVYRCNGAAPIDAARVEALCAKVGWPQRPRAKLEAALRNSFLVASLHLQVIDGGDGGGAPGPAAAAAAEETLVGLARATSDHAFNATIWDVIVDPDYQGQGLGRALVEQVVRALLRREIGNVTLFADAKVVEFYRQMGFECDPEGIKGMFWYPR
jgi:GNAT superfamily N-acetyltransferase